MLALTVNTPYSISLWNANGLRATTIHNPLSDVLLVTETWLTSPMLIPTNWAQFHLYGKKVLNAHNRGSGGITALVNPHCTHTILQLPSPNNHTLSLKIGDLRVHCVYAPPSINMDQFIDILNSIVLGPNTIICGDFNARLGDHNSNSRGPQLLS